MLKELTEELLDLQLEVKRVNRALMGDTIDVSLCCTTTCSCCKSGSGSGSK